MASIDALRARATAQVAELAQTLRDWPWTETLRTLARRFREDRLGLTASSLTFTTTLSLVPLLTVMLALFTAFPIFGQFQVALQQYFLRSLIPDTIAKPVLRALTQFATKASELGSAGLVFLLLSALVLMLTIDHTLNAIWRVRRPRPIAQRLLVYWAALTLGPLLLGMSLSVTSVALTESRGMVDLLPGGVGFVLQALQFGLIAIGVAGLYRYVPNTDVRWRHAIAGGLFVAVGFEVAKRALAWYLSAVPGYSVIYGAFATVPILLLWIYLSWVIVLLGAVIAAYAPSLKMRILRQDDGAGQPFALAVALLRELHRARAAPPRGLTLGQMAAALRVDPLQVEAQVDALIEIGWVGRLDEPGPQRHVLVCDPAATPAAPLVDRLLLAPGAAVLAFRRRTAIDTLTVAELIGG